MPLAGATVSDRQRLGILLEGCALVAHLAAVGGRARPRWERLRVSPRGRLVDVELTVPAVAPVSARDLALDLLARLFGGDGAGRGEARRIARDLERRWLLYLTPVDADAIVADVLGASRFLWEARFAAYRESLAAVARGDGVDTLTVAGPASFRRRSLRSVDTLSALHDRLRGGDAVALWRGEPALEVREPSSLAWRRSRRRRPSGAARGAPVWDLEPLATACRLGRFTAAAREAARLRHLEAPPGERARLARLAIQAQLHLLRFDAARTWAAFAVGDGRERAGEDASLLEAWVEHEIGDGGGAAPAAPPSGAAIDTLLLWSRVTADRDPEAVIERLSSVLRQRGRPGTGGADAAGRGGAWLELGRARLAAGVSVAAERAFGHALRHARRGEQPVDLWRAAAAIAGARVRRGELGGVDRVVADLAVQARAAGDRRRALDVAALGLRLELARGRAEAVEREATRLLDTLAAQRRERAAAEIEVLRARALGWLGRREEAARRLEAIRADATTGLDPEERAAVWALAGRRDRALLAARSLGAEEAWRRLLDGASAQVQDLAPRLEGYRAARLLVDAVLLGHQPSEQERRAAAATLERLGAPAHARRLVRDCGAPWAAARRFLEAPAAGRAELERLFREAGHDGVELLRIGEGGAAEQLVDGPGGEEEVVAPIPSGRLLLRCARRPSEDLRGLLALVRERLARSAPAEASRSHVVAHGGVPPAPRAAKATGAGARSAAIVGRSRPLRDALERIDRLARGDMPVLLSGETGTGKELAASRLHLSSPRRGRPFVAVNCAALSESLLLSELFGHVRGAFTGADRDHAGVFETAHEGVVFLDEIGDLPLGAQGALLRVLQEGEVRRVGESKPRRIDVRVVAATHRDLSAWVESGRFRQDLYYRLSGAAVRLPPLRERGEDVLLLARHFLAEQGAQLDLEADAEDRLLACSWPGNVRELRSVVQVAATVHQGGRWLRADDLELPPSPRRPASYHAALDRERRRLLADALAACGGRRADAARRLGITPQAISYLLRRLAGR